MATQQPVPIAVVGSGCRFPGSSSSPSALWKLLENPRDVSKEIPDDRFELQGYYHPKGTHHGTTNVLRSYILEEDVRSFDATFFNISPNEAESMDPQQRLLMEVVYEALEAGGHTIEGLRGSDTAVFVGTMSVDYNDILLRDIRTTPTYFSTGTSRAILSNRISYFFDWHGPSMTIDTACSSSMVALHQGVRSLRTGESRVAIAGGTELLLGPEQFVGESKMSLLSPDGRSRMWDADANGYARGDGVAALVLKRLDDAIADGDHIEFLVRETGVNQDGKSSGLTVPSPEAQVALIRGTYARAGLDLSNPRDWPQFFEAHGTGTKAGDPREASAISSCFGSQPINGNPLYVGSVKTIIGHTEGTAGLAGVFKAALAIQNGVMPPNMLLNRLNPDIEQYIHNLHIPTSAMPWPETPEGVPRRASVNSFGFGGTNGHAIVEGYLPPAEKSIDRASTAFTPFTFSAVTNDALTAVLQKYSEFLKANDTINLRDLAWTLQTRRSSFPYKASFSATSVQTLISKIDKHITDKKSAARSAPAKPKILGVFTGQGAQWPTVGAELIKSSAFVRKRLEELDESLQTLPESDRPSWRIADQLSAPKGVSRIAEAALSQPLCTAIQVVLVDLLRSANVKFDAVVGHSSGEIGAAYAADFISARDAIRIAYYRGFHAGLAKGPQGQKGSMLAVGTSWEDAEELLELPAFKGRVKIAAQNSPASLTLSGDADGIAHVKRVFDEEKKFARALLVDTAYHSHHMLPCSDAYVASLRACGVKVNQNRDKSCSWYSSVKHGELMDCVDELKDLYWRDNMVNAVLFAEAVTSAVDEGFNLGVEVGVHPALKGPAQQNISEVRSPLPYTGVLLRNTNDVEAFADGLGFIWTQLGVEAVNFQGYDNLVSPSEPAKLLVGLPSYPWNDSIHWHESRLAKRKRLRGAAFHELLGVPSPNNTEQNFQWTNFLKSSEIPWLDGHQLQGQTIYPAAGYVAMALEAAKKLAGTKSIKILELHDLIISKAIVFDQGANFAVETLTSLTAFAPNRDDRSYQEADFTIYSCPNTGASDMELVSSGRVRIVFGEPEFGTLSSTPLDQTELVEVDSDRFYSSLVELGYGYNGPFRTLSNTKRKLNQASATVDTYGYADEDVPFVVHPTMLDVAFQASFLAQMSPGDEQLWSLHVPTSIKCIRVNPELCSALPNSSVKLPVSAVLDTPDSIAMRSSIDVFDEDGELALIQIEDLVMKPVTPAQATDDRPMFSTVEYGVGIPDSNLAAGHDHPSRDEVEIADICERLIFHYLQKWKAEIDPTQWESDQKYQSLQSTLNRLLPTVESERHPTVRKEWLEDNVEELMTLVKKYPDSIDLKIISTFNEDISGLIRGQPDCPNTPLQDSVLNELFEKGLGFSRRNTLIANLVRQITHRYPHTNILEIGGESGSIAKTILESLDDKFSSYTFTNNSEKSIEAAAERLKVYRQKLSCKAFDSAQAPASQGFTEGSYDIVIAANPLHGTVSDKKNLQNVRRFLKPGGYLLLVDLARNVPLRMQVVIGCLSDKAAKISEGNRTSMVMWHNTLRKSGFSGVDAQTPGADTVTWPFSVIVSQAVDENIEFLRNPLLEKTSSVQLEELVILGNQSVETWRIAEEITKLAGPFCSKITVLEGLPTDDDEIGPLSTFINLVDLDAPIFSDFTDQKMESLKCLFELAKNVVWVTRNARNDEPYHSASIGFGRSIAYEYPQLSLQFLDLDNVGYATSRLITECVLRLVGTEEWETDAMLWSKEPELYQKDQQIFVPRIIPNGQQNARINSMRRAITKTVNPLTSTVLISKASDGTMSLHEEASLNLPTNDNHRVQISSSTLYAVNVAPGVYMYPAIATDEATGEEVVCLSGTNSSRSTDVVSTPIQIPANLKSAFLAAVSCELLAARILARLPESGHILVHQPGQHSYFTTALAQQAPEKGIRITYSTTSMNKEDPAWIRLTRWTPAHSVKRSIPATVTHFLDLTAEGATKETSELIKSCLPHGSRCINASDFLSNDSLPPTGDHAGLLEFLKSAVSRAQMTKLDHEPRSILRPSQIGDFSVRKLYTAIIDWTLESQLTVHVQSINARNLFSRNCTYLLVGLSGPLGKSMCEWMSRNGAGCICLTSRSAKSDEKWQASLQETGTTVKFFAMDVTKKSDLERTVNEIRKTCPRIAGVINGAALFRDTLFSEMTMERMEGVMKPKIDGTKYLDAVFGDTPLDFFIVLSSLTSVIGNSGQTNYTAANAYMTGLMRQRRKRGLAGTSLEIGRIAGIGYMERAGDVARDQLIRFGFMAISETDVHQLIAEGIRAGAPNSGENSILTIGCRTVDKDEENPVAWLHDPRFSHKIIESSDDGKNDGGSGKKSSLPVREQLAAVTTKQEALEVMKVCFANKLAMISNLDAEKVDHSAPLAELGIDSLVAVEVRGWFLKELKTDMPVLKVLGGGSVTDLCQQALEKLPETMLPGIGGDKGANQKGGAAKSAQPKGQAPKPGAAPKAGAQKSSTPKSTSKAGPSDASASKLERVKTADSDSTVGSSSVDSSSAQSNVQTPATSAPALSQSASAVNLAEAAKKASQSKTSTSYVKTELISLPQSRFWFLRLLVEDQTTFNITFYYKITGNLRVGDLERAVRLVSDRHESLRTCFTADDEHADLAYQNVLPRTLVRLERKKIETMEDLQTEYDAMKAIPFDLTSGKLLRLILLTKSSSEHYLLFNYHHILMDGVSLQVFLSDLEKAYHRRSMGAPPRQLPEYSRYQRTAIENGSLNDQLDYWRSEFPKGHPVLPLLPMAKINSRMPMKSFSINQVGRRLEPELMARIKEISRKNRSTPFHFYLAVYKAMLFRFTGAEDLTIGIADANRNDTDTMTTIGLLLNLLTLRFQTQSDQTFADCITDARTKAYKALENSNVPFDVLLTELNVPRSAAYSPFFQAFFDYRQGQQEKFEFGNTTFEFSDLQPGRTAYDMTLDITDNPTDAHILFRTQAGLYDATATRLLLDTYVHMCEVFANDSSLPLKDAPLFSEKQLENVTSVGRGWDLKSKWPETLPRRIDQIARDNGDKLAIKDGHGKQLTYTAMTERIEAIAEAMQKSGVKEGSRVLVFEDATADWPCSMLAIMRLGAVYVPLDLRNPLPRLADVAGSCKPYAILVDDSTVKDAPEVNVGNAKIVNVSKVGPAPSAHIRNVSRANNVAAILFSSGSTGKPKGIIVKHSGLRNEIEGYTTQWGLKNEMVLQQSAFTFNHSSDQMYTGLTNAGTVYVVPWSKRGDPVEVSKLIADEKITYTKATPAEYAMWLDYGRENLNRATSWRFGFGGGESLTAGFVKELATLNLPNFRFFNSYGPTEISISSTKMEIAYREEPPEGRIPCGFSLPNYVAYILDDQMKPVPVGMPGELWYGGAGVSLGYLDNKELTDHHFVPDPYATQDYVDQGWTTMYRTGDIAHLQEDGAMVFHGRIAGDTQVKLRGLRIELGDIESNIVQASKGKLREAAVTLRDGDPQLLVVHVVFAPNHNLADTESYLQHLLNHLQLPQYMIPAMAIPLDRMPLTNHSKVDRKTLKTLPLPKRAEKASDEDEGELSETMLGLKKLWVKTLGAKDLNLNIARSTSFFTIGGNSLLIVRLQSAIRSAFNVTVRLVDLLGASTLAEMAQLIEESTSVDVIDWQKEIALPDISSLGQVDRKPLKTNGKVLLVTGAGGFLGKHILAELIASPEISKIHCVGLRDKPAGTPRKLAVSSPKIVAYQGDLTEPWLGLSESTFWGLASEVDAILHMGAMRPFHDNYHILRPNNVEPTKLLIQFAATRQIPIHYTSTAGVLTGNPSIAPAASVADSPPASDGSNGYIATRWTCEQILEGASSKLKIPTTIHRFIPSERPAPETTPPALEHFITLADSLSLMPDFSGIKGTFDMTPAEQAATKLANGLIGSPSDQATRTEFLHHECNIRIDMMKMKAFMEQQRGDKGYSTMPVLQFIGQMKRNGLQYYVTSQKLLMGRSDGQIVESIR